MYLYLAFLNNFQKSMCNKKDKLNFKINILNSGWLNILIFIGIIINILDNILNYQDPELKQIFSNLNELSFDL